VVIPSGLYLDQNAQEEVIELLLSNVLLIGVILNHPKLHTTIELNNKV